MRTGGGREGDTKTDMMSKKGNNAEDVVKRRNNGINKTFKYSPTSNSDKRVPGKLHPSPPLTHTSFKKNY